MTIDDIKKIHYDATPCPTFSYLPSNDEMWEIFLRVFCQTNVD